MSEATAPTDPHDLINRALAENRLAHALLVHGQNIAAVERFALALSTRILDLPYSEDDLEDSLLRHPDVFTLRPSKKSRIISVDDTRETIRKIQHSPQAGDRKVAIVFEVDRFNTSAANAFLKTLEEPPLNTTILLMTTRPHSLLATIRSRCQLFRLPTEAHSFDDPQCPSLARKLSKMARRPAKRGARRKAKHTSLYPRGLRFGGTFQRHHRFPRQTSLESAIKTPA